MRLKKEERGGPGRSSFLSQQVQPSNYREQGTTEGCKQQVTYLVWHFKEFSLKPQEGQVRGRSRLDGIKECPGNRDTHWRNRQDRELYVSRREG